MRDPYEEFAKLAKKRGMRVTPPPKKEENYSKPKQSHNGSRNKNSNAKPKSSKPTGPIKEPKKATAPYNFVSLTNTILESPLDGKQDAYKEYIQSEGKYSGTIDLNLENLTPLFIGTKNEKSDTFFSPAGKPIIPGSTIRGMIRNLFKIITAGTMRRDEDFTDRHLYYRCIMATKNLPQLNALHEEYVSRMTSERKDKNGKTEVVKNAKPGFLFQTEETKTKYFIAPCEQQSIKRRELAYDDKNSCVIWNEKEKRAYIWTGRQKGKDYVRYLSKPDWDKAIEVPNRIITEYGDDRNRRGVDLITKEKNKNIKKGGSAAAFAQREGVTFIAPCYFIREDDKVTAFGHGRSFRIPYKHSVGDRVPQEVQSDTVDFADAVFGRKELWAGRVSFEDAEIIGAPNFLQSALVKPLLGANPTSFQLYLKQAKYPPAHWDSPDAGTIRGYKFYWHKQISSTDWQAKTKEERNESVTHAIKPLAKGQHFTAKIHFRELSDIELGALLKVFSLGTNGQDIVFKIGLGKSLGMGSVRIKATLHLDSKKRYEQLFAANGWDEDTISVDTQDFIKAFDEYAKAKLGKSYKSYEISLWELRLMLDWNNTKKTGWASKVASMSGNVQDRNSLDKRFMERSLLPTPEDIVR